MRPAVLALAFALVAATVALGCGEDAGRSPRSGSTLERTVADRDGDGGLEAGPGEPLRPRGERRGRTRRVLGTLAVISDAHVVDEESPGRVPFLDRLGSPFTSAFRPQEPLSAHVLDATVRAVNAERPDAVLVAGDLIDSAQVNEDRLARAVLDGGVAEPDSGRAGYDGVQDASSADAFFHRPDLDAPRHPGLLDRAQRPFPTAGLDAPWHLVPGNHDVLVQGELAPSPATDAAATGSRLVTAPTEETLALAGTRPENLDDVVAAGIPGRDRQVPADPGRRARPVPPPQDTAFDVGRHLRVVALDLASRTGGSAGVVRPETRAFLAAELARRHDRTIVVVSHQALEDAEAQVMLDRDPRVVAELSGHRHAHRVTERGGRRWVIETASLADWPQQARVVRLVETADGGRALETHVVDHDGRGLAGISRELAHLDVQGGRPRGATGRPEDRNARLSVPPRGSPAPSPASSPAP